MKWNFIIPLTLILVSVTNSNAVLDTTKIGIEEGDVYHYKVVAFNYELNSETDYCFHCNDTGPEFIVSQGDEFTMEILSITGNAVDLNFTKGEESVEGLHRLDQRKESNILYTDWEYWPGSIADDWAFWYEAKADPQGTFADIENLVNFTAVIIHEVDNNIFNTHLERQWTYTVDEIDGWKSYTGIQHIEYELETGVMSQFIINTTINFWNDTIKTNYIKTELEKSELFTSSELDSSTILTTSSESSSSSDSIIELRWFLVPFTMFVIQRRKRHQSI